ncbi:MAG: hypothetical protein KF812_00865 [Fimbriimonadaceae bacterium]|nr:hypothetical protein [Fimbriimonadaceae bacterium]
MRHFLLIYHLAPNYLERRPEFRGAHLRLADEAVERGELVLGGALLGPTDTAMLLFRGEDGSAAKLFAETDPYVREGLIDRWEVREWATVAGKEATVAVPR